MKQNRRAFIKSIAVGIIGNTMYSSFPNGVYANQEQFQDGIEIHKGFVIFNKETQKSMEALAEALIPGSKDIRIRDIFMKNISKNHGLGGFLDAGIWKLDSISRSRFKQPFYSLENKEDIDFLIKYTAALNSAFFDQFRKTIISLYYSNPAVWKQLSYNGPPQPVGFMGYSLPPK